MPELPEVETTVRGLNEKVLKRTFVDVWTDTEKIVKNLKFLEFKKQIKGKRVEKIWRRGKNIIIELSGDKVMLVHQKMTGHFLYGKWERKGNKWIMPEKGSLSDPWNRFLRLVFYLDNGDMLALSDLRKFAKIELYDQKDFEKALDLGPEPLEVSFSEFKTLFLKTKRKIKQALLDQTIIVGIGNIYADEILWKAKVSPFKPANELTNFELKRIFQNMKDILKKAIELKGTSTSDYRDVLGERGGFGNILKVYRKTGEKCFRCKTKIKREKVGMRSTHFCPECQI